MAFVAAIAPLVLASCAGVSLEPSNWEGYYGSRPTSEEVTARINNYLAQNSLVLAIPKNSVRKEPATATITPAFLEPITVPPARNDGTWPEPREKFTGYYSVIATDVAPPDTAYKVGYAVTTTDTYLSPAGAVVGAIKFEFFLSKGRDVVFLVKHEETGDVHLVRKPQ
jgi:hypothetical protein